MGVRGMASFEHDILVELVLNQPLLARDLLRACAGVDVGSASVEIGSPDLSQVAPTEFRADAALVFRDSEHQASAAVVVEVQRSKDPDKRWTWPLYVAALRARCRCPVTLLVIVPDLAVAQWARQRIELGHPQLALTPIVASIDNIPRVVSEEEARRVPELAVLSSIVHAEEAIVLATVAAVMQLPDDKAKLYYEAVMLNVPGLVRRNTEKTMSERGFQPQLEYGKKLYKQGIDDGERKGREQMLSLITTLLRERFSILDAAAEARLRDGTEDLSALVLAIGLAADKQAAQRALDGWGQTEH